MTVFQPKTQSMQNNIPFSKTKRSIYSSSIFPTDNNDRRSIFKTGDFKSSSSGCFSESSRRFADQLKDRLTVLQRHQDSSTQTSKTILQLAQIESNNISPDSLNVSPKLQHKSSFDIDTQTSVGALTSSGYLSCDNDNQNKGSPPPPNSGKNLSDGYPETIRDFFNDTNCSQEQIDQISIHSGTIDRCFPPVRTQHSNFFREKSFSTTQGSLPDIDATLYRKTNSSCSSPRPSTRGKTTYMTPTISSEKKNAQIVIRKLNQLFKPKRGRSVSPSANDSKERRKNIPLIERSASTISHDPQKKPSHNRKTDFLKKDASINSSTADFVFNKEIFKKDLDETSNSYENLLASPLAKIKDPDWNTCIQGLAEIVDCCRMVDLDLIFPYMTTVNQKVIELIRSPRSHVCRTACQAAGHLFEFVRDTRRPEFDELVDLLLSKTADANKFIRQDANLALDCMVTHIPTSHAVRALCSKGPAHKNYLVRTATVRLIVCAVVIAGPDTVLNPNNSEQTRKRIFYHMPKFIEDKSLDVRRFGERLFKVLSKEFKFELYLKKYLDKEEILNMRKNLRNIAFKS